jgi:hypothetical protein
VNAMLQEATRQAAVEQLGARTLTMADLESRL